MDPSFDLKHVVAIEGTDPALPSGLGGQCAYVTIDPTIISSEGVFLQTFCYAADEVDDDI